MRKKKKTKNNLTHRLPWNTCLDTRFSEVDTEAVRVFAIVFYQLLQSAEGGSSGNEEASFVQLPNPIVLDCVSVSDCKNEIRGENQRHVTAVRFSQQKFKLIHNKFNQIYGKLMAHSKYNFNEFIEVYTTNSKLFPPWQQVPARYEHYTSRTKAL